MSTFNTITFDDFVSLEELEWIKQQESLKQSARESGIFRVGRWEPNTGELKKYIEIDAEEYASIKDEGDDADIASVQQGFSKSASPVRYGKDFPVTWEMRNRNKYQNAVRALTQLRAQTANRLDLDLSHRITFGTSTTYTNMEGRLVDVSVGDTLALFSTAHTLNGSASTYRNRLAGNPALSVGALEAMEKQIVENTLNQFGTKMSVDFDILFTTDDPNTINTARELLQSTAKISATNDGVTNVYQGKYKHVILNRVATTATGAVDSTKAKYWGLVSSSMSSAYLDVEQEPTEEPVFKGGNREEASTEDWTFGTRGSWSICIVGAKFAHESTGDGVA